MGHSLYALTPFSSGLECSTVRLVSKNRANSLGLNEQSTRPFLSSSKLRNLCYVDIVFRL